MSREIPIVAVLEWLNTNSPEARGAIARGLREAGYTQVEVAECLDVSSRTVSRYEAKGDQVRTFPPAPPAMTAVDHVPEAVVAHLTDLQSLASQVRGWTPHDSPARHAAEELGDAILSVVDQYGVTTYALSKRMGLSVITLDFWLKRHGYRKNPPSQKTYRNVVSSGGGKGGAKTIRVIGGECKHGHHLTEESTYRTGRGYLRCKSCISLRGRARYQRMKEAR